MDPWSDISDITTQYQVMVSCLASGVGKDEVESSISEETLVMNTLIHNITRETIKMINVIRKPKLLLLPLLWKEER